LLAQLSPILLTELACALLFASGLLLCLERRTQIGPAALRTVCGNFVCIRGLILAWNRAVPACCSEGRQATQDNDYSRSKTSVHGALTHGAIARNTLLC
jgi:hypothetical protein